MRLFWRANLADSWINYDPDDRDDPDRWRELINQERVAALPEDANLVSSLCADGQHMPAIDIDLPIRVKPSSTEGHFHLFIDKKIPAEKYWELLRVMADCGIVEQGFYELSVARGSSFLRTHRKGERDHMIYPETDPNTLDRSALRRLRDDLFGDVPLPVNPLANDDREPF